MERLLEEGTCRAIGVSNFSVKELVELMDNCSVVPHVSRLHNIGFDLFSTRLKLTSLSVGESVRVPSLSKSQRTEDILSREQYRIPGLYAQVR